MKTEKLQVWKEKDEEWDIILPIIQKMIQEGYTEGIEPRWKLGKVG